MTLIGLKFILQGCQLLSLVSPGMVQGLLQIQHQLHLSLIIHNTTRGSYTAQAAQREIGRRPRPRAIGSLATAGNYWFGSRSPACIFPSALVCATNYLSSLLQDVTCPDGVATRRLAKNTNPQIGCNSVIVMAKTLCMEGDEAEQ